MSELSSDSPKTTDLPTIVLYFTYLVFFLPYIFKLLNFLSPLFVTTSLLLLALLTISPKLLYRNVVSDSFDDLERFEELEAFKIVFEVDQDFEVSEEKEEKCEELETIDKCVIMIPTDAKPKDGEIEVKEVKKVIVETDKVVEQPPLRRSGSKASGDKIKRALLHTISDVSDSSEEYSREEFMTPKASFDPSLGSFGSMRKEKEKEWKRTLACKLFEERHNGEGGGGAEGMDMLWETYEAESTKIQLKSYIKKDKKDRSCNEIKVEDDEDEVGAQLCCLQALKFSAGKMNLGMGRPSLVKFSKALKGMGWLHHKSSKKMYR